MEAFEFEVIYICERLHDAPAKITMRHLTESQSGSPIKQTRQATYLSLTVSDLIRSDLKNYFLSCYVSNFDFVKGSFWNLCLDFWTKYHF